MDNTQVEHGRYRGILKATSLIGGASGVNILISMVRTKFVAVLLGASGVGLAGMFDQIVAVVKSISGMGLGSSGVRQVAEAVGTGDEDRVARTVITLRRAVWVTGFLGMAALALFREPIARTTFGNTDHATETAFLGIIILLAAITSGQSSILQGTRRIGDLARISILGAVNGTIISLPLYYFFGERGIVPAMILNAAAALAVSWWHARRVRIKDIAVSWRESLNESRTLFALGLGFMGAGLAAVATNYMIRVLLVREFALAQVGIYQSAFSLSGILVGFVLSAMAADYYPRLTSRAHDNEEVHRMVNEQGEVALLLGLPCLAAMMVFAPLLIRIFYTEEFMAAVPVLRWCIFGALGRLLAWPLGFVIVAKGRGRLFFFTELSGNGAHLAGLYLFTQLWGLNGAGIAFMAMYIYYTLLMHLVMWRLAGKTWNRASGLLAAVSVAVLAFLFANSTWNPEPYSRWGIGVATVLLAGLLCLRRLSRKSGVGVADFAARLPWNKRK